MTDNVNRTRVLLSAQRALLGEVFPDLRAVTVEWNDRSIRIYAFVDGPLSERDAESLSCVSAEVAADFTELTDVDYEAVCVDSPRPISAPGTWGFKRREG